MEKNKKRLGRPPGALNTELVTARLPTDLAKKLRDHAQQQDRSIATMLRVIVRDYLNKLEDE